MKNYKYEVKMMLNDSIVNAKYTCSRGKIICHYIASLALYINYNLSSTD